MQSPLTVNEENRKKRIEELKHITRQLLASLEVGEAYLSLLSGVLVVDESYQYFKTTSPRPETTDKRLIRCLYALSHEVAHMVQSLSSFFVAGFSLNMCNLVADVTRGRMSGAAEADWLPEAIRNFSALQDRLKSREQDCDLSVLDLIEMYAVIEGFKGAFIKNTLDGLILTIECCHGTDSRYADPVGRLLKHWGFEFTLHVVPKLVWLALQDSDPVGKFLENLSQIDTADPTRAREWWKVSASEFCEFLGYSVQDVATPLRQRACKDICSHPMFKARSGYFDALEKETDPEGYLLLVMHPGELRPLHQRVNVESLMPPLAVFADNVCVLGGPYSDKGWAVVDQLFDLAKLSMETLIWLKERADSTPVKYC
jgi:hypothetical protein